MGVVGTAALGLTTAGCLEEGDRSDPEITQDVVESNMAEQLAITEASLYRGEGAFGVRGTVANEGDRPMTNVEVHVRLIDPDDALVGEFYDDHADEEEVWRLAPGETDEFDVRFEDTEPATVNEAVRYEIWADGEVGR